MPRLAAMHTFNALSLKGCLLLVSVALLPRAFESFVLSSSQASYVIDLEHGCSVSGAWAAGDPAKTNLINTADLGRYVQVRCVRSLPFTLSLRHGVFPGKLLRWSSALRRLFLAR